jgi:hypothetical protein
LFTKEEPHLTPRWKRQIGNSLLCGFGLDVGLTVLGLMHAYPAGWQELFPGTIIARKVFGGFLNPEGLLGAFVFDGLGFTLIALVFWNLHYRLYANQERE